MEFIDSYKEMITEHGWNGTAGHLGMSKSALEARVYEKKGQGMSVDTAMLIQDFSGTKLFAHAVAHQSGGLFVEMPDPEQIDNEMLLTKFNELYSDLGRLSREWMDATADGEIDKHERAKLDEIGYQINAHAHEILALSYQLYCKQPAGVVR